VVQVQGPWLEQVTTRYWNPGGRLSDLVSPQVRELVIVSTEVHAHTRHSRSIFYFPRFLDWDS